MLIGERFRIGYVRCRFSGCRYIWFVEERVGVDHAPHAISLEGDPKDGRNQGESKRFDRYHQTKRMDSPRLRDLSCAAKIARVVLENRGPLSPSEIAQEAYISEERAETGINDLRSAGFVEPVCGVCDGQEEVFALTESANPSV